MKKNSSHDEDFLLFSKEFSKIKVIKSDIANIKRPKPRPIDFTEIRKSATKVISTTNDYDLIPRDSVTYVDPEDYLEWFKDGIQKKQISKLKKGRVSFLQTLDLHGMVVEDARSILSNFLNKVSFLQIRCVRIIHGKSIVHPGKNTAIIKSHVNEWLKNHPKILGFCSCLASHGGNGSIYVMLKSNIERKSPKGLYDKGNILC